MLHNQVHCVAQFTSVSQRPTRRRYGVTQRPSSGPHAPDRLGATSRTPLGFPPRQAPASAALARRMARWAAYEEEGEEEAALSAVSTAGPSVSSAMKELALGGAGTMVGASSAVLHAQEGSDCKLCRCKLAASCIWVAPGAVMPS